MCFYASSNNHTHDFFTYNLVLSQILYSPTLIIPNVTSKLLLILPLGFCRSDLHVCCLVHTEVISLKCYHHPKYLNLLSNSHGDYFFFLLFKSSLNIFDFYCLNFLNEKEEKACATVKLLSYDWKVTNSNPKKNLCKKKR